MTRLSRLLAPVLAWLSRALCERCGAACPASSRSAAGHVLCGRCHDG